MAAAQDFPKVDPQHPATFRERGVAAPLTTPKLAGGRLRVSDRNERELVVPNPSGGRGLYVVALTKIRERYRPTVHDMLLLERVADLQTLDPSTVRGVAQALALEGYAGPKAREAAETACRMDRSQLMATEFLLLNALVRQAEPEREAIISFAQAAELERRGRVVLGRLGRSFGRSGAQLGESVAALASVFTPVGVTAEDSQSRIARLIDRLQDTRDDLCGQFASAAESGGGYLARSVAASMDVVLACARGLLQATRALVGDPLTLLYRWIAEPAKVSAAVSRCEWVLDGWEQICLLWQCAPDRQRRWAALLEMAQLVPFLPLETMSWSLRPLTVEALVPAVRIASQSDEWRSGGTAISLTERNEMIRAMAF